MIFATTIFFEPDWPRRMLGGQPLKLPPPQPLAWQSLSRGAKLGFALLAAYCVFHSWWPLRHQLYGRRRQLDRARHYLFLADDAPQQDGRRALLPHRSRRGQNLESRSAAATSTPSKPAKFTKDPE